MSSYESQVAVASSYTAEASTSHVEHAESRPIDDGHLHSFPAIPSDAVDDVFGDRLRSEPSEQDILPPYLEEPPAYSSSGSSEPVTLAMYLFKFGFLFPPFWIMGAFIILSPLRQPESTSSTVWLPEKTESERQEIIQKMRKAEVKWAKRCLIAFCILVVVAVAVSLAIWGILRA